MKIPILKQEDDYQFLTILADLFGIHLSRKDKSHHNYASIKQNLSRLQRRSSDISNDKYSQLMFGLIDSRIDEAFNRFINWDDMSENDLTQLKHYKHFVHLKVRKLKDIYRFLAFPKWLPHHKISKKQKRKAQIYCEKSLLDYVALTAFFNRDFLEIGQSHLRPKFYYPKYKKNSSFITPVYEMLREENNFTKDEFCLKLEYPGKNHKTIIQHIRDIEKGKKPIKFEDIENIIQLGRPCAKLIIIMYSLLLLHNLYYLSNKYFGPERTKELIEKYKAHYKSIIRHRNIYESDKKLLCQLLRYYRKNKYTNMLLSMERLSKIESYILSQKKENTLMSFLNYDLADEDSYLERFKLLIKKPRTCTPQSTKFKNLKISLYQNNSF